MTRTVSGIVVLIGWLAGSAFAQDMYGVAPRDPSRTSLADIFGRDKSFTATARQSIKIAGGKTTQMEMSLAVLKGMVRTEMDMSKIQDGSTPPETLAQLQAMGLDKIVSITVPEKRMQYTIYPGLRAWCSEPIGPASATAEPDRPPKIERTEIGKETIDGHPCVKYKVVITVEGEAPLTAYVWQGIDLKDYPVQTEVTAEGVTITTLFQNINLTKPAASLFEPTSDYREFRGPYETLMMMEIMKASEKPGAGGGQ